MKIQLVNDDGEIVGSHDIRLQADDLQVEEYTLKLKAKNLYRDFLYSRGLWNKENHAKLGGTYWHD